ncbi:CopG family transcriptional regulator [Anatilimnocola floriformis]|uniref:CopG family transcriptional regulator n=1 Tax=Anatilimnocola floriformis TaxID=2948575 RepID=UPI0020C55A7D|nr:CopG family transcriptional regulator [Anatilimnocola floriformis]
MNKYKSNPKHVVSVQLDADTLKNIDKRIDSLAVQGMTDCSRSQVVRWALTEYFKKPVKVANELP